MAICRPAPGPIPGNEPMDRILRYLLLIRLFAIGGLCLGLGVMHGIYAVPVPWGAIAAVLIALALVTLLGWRRGTTPRGAPQRRYLVQLSADMIALSALVYFTGGAFNPFGGAVWALDILESEVGRGKVDRSVFELFVGAKVWASTQGET